MYEVWNVTMTPSLSNLEHRLLYAGRNYSSSVALAAGHDFLIQFLGVPHYDLLNCFLFVGLYLL